MIMVKNLSGADSWAVYHKDLSTNNFLELNFNYAQASGSNPRFLSGDYGTSTPTSTYFYVRNYSGSTTNDNGDDYVAYCFHSVEGFSKFGSYTGNESATKGPFIYTGFKPAWVMVKGRNTVSSWVIIDNTRTPDNSFLSTDVITADGNGAQESVTDTTLRADFFSNGFSMYSGSNSYNNSGTVYVYMAFAETPFKYATAR